MHRSKLSLLGLCALAVGVMAFSAASAQAAEWLILTGGTPNITKTAAELNAAASITLESGGARLNTRLIKLKLEISCTGGSLLGTSLEGEGKLTSGGKAEFTGCKTINAATKAELPECGVKAGGGAVGKIITAATKGQLQSSGRTKIEPKTGTTLATLEFEAGCVLPSPTTVNGVLFVEDCEGKLEMHLLEHLIVQGVETSLFVGADTAEHLETSLVGSAWLKLINNHLGRLFGGMIP
jgi:hypothetical protein